MVVRKELLSTLLWLKAALDMGSLRSKTQEYGQRAWKIFHHTLEDEKNAPLLFSKEYHHPNNAQEGYHAIMVCDSANEACPVVFGPKQRHSLLL